MSVCQWLIQNLSAIGLAIDFLGAILIAGTRLPLIRKLGFWLFPEHKRRLEGYKSLLQNGEILADEPGFEELRTALFPTSEDKIFAPATDQEAQELFSDENVEPVKIKKEDFSFERIDDEYPPTRPDSNGGIVTPEDILTISELHYIADEAPHISNVDRNRKVRRSYDDVDRILESQFEDSMLYFGVQVLAFGFLLQFIALAGIV